MQNKSEKIKERQALIDRWKASGKSINAFCKQENVSYYTLLYWRKKLENQTPSKGFIKIKPTKNIKPNDSTCELIFSNGNRINFSICPEVVYLKELLS